MRSSVGENFAEQSREELELAATLNNGLIPNDVLMDMVTRRVAQLLSDQPGFEVVPICKYELSTRLRQKAGSQDNRLQGIVSVICEAFPLPDESCAWQDILEFKSQMHDKQWGFRRFLRTLATKKQTEAEIRDDIEWSLNEYTNAMRLHHVEVRQNVVEAIVIPVMEIAEDLIKINWSKLARAGLRLKKRKVELLEAEMKAPGRECAYVFDAENWFSRSV